MNGCLQVVPIGGCTLQGGQLVHRQNLRHGKVLTTPLERGYDEVEHHDRKTAFHAPLHDASHVRAHLYGLFQRALAESALPCGHLRCDRARLDDHLEQSRGRMI